MPLIRWCRETFSLENMPQMAPTSITNNLNPVSICIHIPSNRSRDSIKKRRPSTSTRELGIRGVKGCMTGSTGVDSWGAVLVVFTGVGAFGALLTEDSELVGREDGAPFFVGLLVGHCCCACCCCCCGGGGWGFVLVAKEGDGSTAAGSCRSHWWTK